MYRVIQYNGDVQISDQIFWRERFHSLKAADFVGKTIASLTVWIPADDYYVLIEEFISEGDINVPVVGYAQGKVLTNADLMTFLAKY